MIMKSFFFFFIKTFVDRKLSLYNFKKKTSSLNDPSYIHNRCRGALRFLTEDKVWNKNIALMCDKPEREIKFFRLKLAI